MKNIPKIVLITFTLSLLGCQQTSSNSEAGLNEVQAASAENSELAANMGMKEQDNMQNKTITVSGKIEYKTFEGGFYAFIADDGRHFTPQGLAPKYRQHGLKMTLTGTPMPDIMTTTQFGTVFNVESIAEVDDSSVTTKPPGSVNPSDI